MNGVKKAIIHNMEFIIDEVKYVADLLDAMDFMITDCSKNSFPFGGVQILFIGDLLQLPPVVKDEEWRILRNHYREKFFFSCSSFSSISTVVYWVITYLQTNRWAIYFRIESFKIIKSLIKILLL